MATEYGSNWLVVWFREKRGVNLPNMVKSIAIYGARTLRVIWASGLSGFGLSASLSDAGSVHG